MHRLMLVASLFLGCASVRTSPSLAPLFFEAGAQQAAPIGNHFERDRGSISDEALAQLLSAPVTLEAHARIGVVPVATGYALDGEVPVERSPARLVDALQRSGLVELATEVSSEWPVAGGSAGLRELAGRYRAEYLLLYRHRFVQRHSLNAAGATYVTLIAALFVPGTRVQTRGVLEATLYDVKTGTLVFTVNERVEADANATPLGVEALEHEQKRRLLDEGVARLADEVIARLQRLDAVRAESVSLRVED